MQKKGGGAELGRESLSYGKRRWVTQLRGFDDEQERDGIHRSSGAATFSFISRLDVTDRRALPTGLRFVSFRVFA